MSNILDTKRMAEGCLYNFGLSHDATPEEIAALVSLKDAFKAAGLMVSKRPSDSSLTIRRRADGKTIATCISL